MRKLKLLFATVVVGFLLGLAVAAFLPQPAQAVGCKFTCWELKCRVPDQWDCHYTPPNPPLYAVYRYFPEANDVECEGPFDCAYDGEPVSCVENCGEIPPPEG